MDWLTEILKPPILPALFVAVGLALLKKPLSIVLSGAIKAMIGFVLLAYGVEMAARVFEPLTSMVWDGFGVHSVLLNSELMGAALMVDYGSEGFCVMLIAIAVNIFLVRYPRTNGVYLTAHHLLYSALLITVVLKSMTPLSSWAVIGIGGITVGIYACLTVKLTQPVLRKVTGKGDIGFANSGNTAALLGSLLGKLFGGKDKFAKEQKTRFEVKDVVILSTVAMFLYYVFFSIAVGNNQSDWMLTSALNAVRFGAAISIVFLGMRMLLADIIQILYKLYGTFASNAVKGLDASAVISYSPVAWIWGFIISFGMGMVVMLASLWVGSEYVVIPGVASCFFTGGASAVFANAYGGKRGVFVSSVVVGLLISLSVTWLITIMPAIGAYGVVFGEVEYGIWGGLVGWILKIIHGT